jgi:signal transduction histidine kinase
MRGVAGRHLLRLYEDRMGVPEKAFPQGHAPVGRSTKPTSESAGELIGAAKIVRDITRQKENDRVLRQAQKMEVVGQLTGGVAHDFNNILAVIMGTIEIIGDEVGDRPDLRAVVNMIDAAATRGAELTARLLAFARKQPLSPLAVDVNMLLQQTVGLLKHTVPENIELVVDLKPHMAPAMVDPDQLVTALLNLAVNSRDAMPDGGKLTIETSDASFDEDYIAQNPEAQPGRHLMIAVSDNGCGIPEKIRDKVFEPFFTTKDVGKGTGLGLSMVYGFVKQSQGHIKIYSELNVGTTIKIYLPQADCDAQSFSKTEVEIVRGADERVLVVEDDELVRETTTRQLRSLGYEVQAVANAKDALGYLKEYQGVDLLLTDVVMSGSTNGRRLAEEAKQLLPELKVVFMSGYTENAIIHHGRLDAGILLISKPFRRADLARIIRRALD